MKLTVMKNIRPGHILLSICWVITFLIIYNGLPAKIISSDVWWHLSAGRFMVENLTFLREDVFSHTLYGYEWINFEWLFQIPMYVMVKLFGLSILCYIKKIALLTSIAATVLLVRYVGSSGQWLILAALLEYHFLLGRPYARPELITFILLPFLILVLLRAKSMELNVYAHKKMICLIFFLMVIWVNVHAGFVYGIGVVALFLVGAIWNRESKVYISFLKILLFLFIFSILLNPFGYKIVLPTLHTFSLMKELSLVLREYAPVSIDDKPIFWTIFFVCAAMFIWGLIKRFENIKFWVPAVFIFMLFGGVYVRNVPISSYIMLAFIGLCIGKLSKNRKINLFGWFLCLVCILLNISGIEYQSNKELIDIKRFPIGATRFLKENNIKGNMFNSYGWGGG